MLFRAVYLFILQSLVSCKVNNCNVIPDVNIQVTFSQADAQEAFTPGGSAYVKGGVSGLIVYNMSTVAGNYEFIAYDRCSPVKPQERNPVNIINNFVAEDPESGAQWFLTDGSPTKISECPLRAYRVLSHGNYYTVVN